MTGRSPRLQARDLEMAELASHGKTVLEIAAALGVQPNTVRLWARAAAVKLPRAPQAVRSKRDERSAKMVSMYRQGVTLAKIGTQYGITRERVRQILRKAGAVASEGGASKQARARRESSSARREAIWLAKYGLPYAVVKQLQAEGVTRSFQMHKRNSDARGIEFRLTFTEWLSVWQASGKLDQRGRGKGKYVMSRIRDDGCYELGNVHIQLATENSKEAVQKWIGKNKEHRGVFLLTPGNARPWMAKVGRVSLGRFATEEAAIAARTAYLNVHPEALRKIVGRGYSHIKATNRSSERFQVMVSKKYVGSYKTAEEALAARAAYIASQSQKEPAHA